MWIFNKEEESIPLHEVVIGKCFKYKDVLFMRTTKEDSYENPLVVGIWSGSVDYLPKNTQVKPVKAVVVTGKSVEEMKMIISERCE